LFDELCFISCFFFSSRRRHTISKRDWSSDVCSSDLTSNLARLAAIRAELPIDVSGYTVHRQCGSGLQAINNADMQIQLGLSDVVVAGGAESMSTAPYYLRNARHGYRAGNGLLLDPNTESQP